MRFYNLLISSAVVTITCIASAAAYYYNSRNKEVTDLIFVCKTKSNACNGSEKLISYIENAKSDVCICTSRLHNPAIQDSLVKLITEKNIKLRIIIGPNGFGPTNFFLKKLVNAGADVISLMDKVENKFCLVDGKVLLMGALDWNYKSSSGHWNYVYVTNKPSLVDFVKADFHRMWSENWTIIDLVDFVELEVKGKTSTPIIKYVNKQKQH